MTSLEFLREALMDFLKKQNIPALASFPQEERKRYHAPLVAVSIKALSAENAGFQNYLGERYDENLRRWEERFGLATSVTFSLDVYSPRLCGEAALRGLVDQLAEAFSKCAPAGLSLKEISWGESRYDQSCDMFRMDGSALCEGVLYAVQNYDGGFISFEVRGGITLE